VSASGSAGRDRLSEDLLVARQLEQRGNIAGANRSLKSALARLTAQASSESLLGAAAVSANLAGNLEREGQQDDAVATYGRALLMARASGRAEGATVGAGIALSCGQLLRRMGRIDEADALLRLATALGRESGTEEALDIAVFASGSLGGELEGRGELEAAETAYREAVELARVADTASAKRAGCFAAGNLSHLLGTRGDEGGADEFVVHAIELGTASGTPEGATTAAMYGAQRARGRGQAHERSGRQLDAAAAYREAVDEGTRSGVPDGLTTASLASLNLGYLHARAGAAEEALRAFAQCLQLGHASGTEVGERAFGEAMREIERMTGLGDFLAEKQPAALEKLLRSQPLLMTAGFAEVLGVLHDVIEGEDPRVAMVIDELRALAGRAASVGPEKAVGEAVPRDPLASLWARASELDVQAQAGNDETLADQTVVAWQEALGTAEREGYGPYVVARISTDLGAALLRQARLDGRAPSAESAFEVLRRAARIVPRPSRVAAMLLVNLGAAWRAVSEGTADSDALENARAVGLEALDLVGPQSPLRPRILVNVGNAAHDAFRVSHEPGDLDAAIAAYVEAVDGLDDQPTVLTVLRATTDALTDRYRAMGDVADLDQALRMLHRGLSLADDDAGLLLELAHTAQDRYLAVGDLDDLELADWAFGRVNGHDDLSPRKRADALAGFAWARWQRYRTSHDGADGETAVDALAAALDQPELDAIERALLGVNAITYLRGSLRFSGEPASPEQIRFVQELAEWIDAAIAGAEVDDAVAGQLYGAVGLAFQTCFEARGDSRDLDRAIARLEQAVNLVPADTPDRPEWLIAYATALRERQDAQSGVAVEQVTEAFREACLRGLETSVESARDAGVAWGAWALSRAAWAEAAEAYGFAWSAARRLFSAQIGVEFGIEALEQAQRAPQRGAFALAKNGQLEDAVVAIEDGRALLLEHAAGRRVDLSRLEAAGHGHLAARYARAAQRIESGARLAAGQDGSSASYRADVVRTAAAELQQVIAEIREIPEFADFLRRPTIDDLARAATAAPLVYVVSAPQGGLALVVRATGAVMAAELPDLTESKLADRAERFFEAYAERATAAPAWLRQLDETAKWLWDVVVEPTRAVLGEAERLVLIPSGALQLLPLQAAWTADSTSPTGRRYLIDDFTLSYGPSARALLSVDPVVMDRALDGVLVVEDPPHRDRPRLPHAANEARAVLETMPSGVHLRGSDATRDAVLDALGEFPIFHFTGHADANVARPLDSALLLAGDDVLTMEELMNRRLVGVRLAVLSACETAVSAREVPEEALGIPTALIQAGAAAAVGAQWTVPDISTAALMARFCDLWIDRGHDPASALRKAQQWLRDGTNAELADVFPDLLPDDVAALPPVARELWETARPYAHPHHWAAFVYVGA
jgi:CHAT domain-containing protein